MSTETTPINDLTTQHAPRLVVADGYTAMDGSEYVHKDFVKVTEPWAQERHIGPVSIGEQFGDVESWCSYVMVYEDDGHAPHLTWNRARLKAILDYHQGIDQPGRCQWIAEHRFQATDQWQAWMSLANGQPRAQKQLVEAFEDLGEDIVEPDSGALLGILRTLRASVKADAETRLNENGSTSVSFKREAKVEGGVEIPPTITIRIPVLKGHTTVREDGRLDPVLYEMAVRIRPGVDDQAHLTFRLSIPRADQTLESVIADRVASAKALLGPDATLLRAG